MVAWRRRTHRRAPSFRDATLLHFHDIISVLPEFKASDEKAARESFAETVINKVVARTLARGLRSP